MSIFGKRNLRVGSKNPLKPQRKEEENTAPRESDASSIIPLRAYGKVRFPRMNRTLGASLATMDFELSGSFLGHNRLHENEIWLATREFNCRDL